MKKKIFLVIFSLIFFSTNIFAYTNTSLFNNERDIKVVSTNHFDIIYKDQSSILANEIYENCEAIYDDICELFDFSKGKKFNVVVTSDIQMFNSFYKSFPSEIVIFDTIATNNYFNYFDEHYMLNVFKHELTHALSLSDDSFVSSTFGNIFSPANVFLTVFQKEGLSVYFESIDNQGRLNNPLYKALLYEVRAEGEFPTYYDVQGQSDIATNGNYYLFGSFFYQYLIDNFGIEKFNEYLKLNSKWNALLFFPSHPFKKVYPIPIEEMWKKFILSIDKLEINNSIEIKTIDDFYPKYIVGSGDYTFVGDYFSKSTLKVNPDDLSVNKYSSSYAHLGEICSNEDTLIFTNYDNSSQPTTYTRVVDKDSSYELDISNFRLANIIDKNTIVGLRNSGELQRLEWLDKDSLTLIKYFNLKEGEAVQNIVLSSSSLIFSSRIGDSNYISVLEDDKRTMYRFGSNVSINGLNVFNNIAILSSTRDGELPRLTLLNLATGEMKYMNSNILGGVYSPTMIDESTVVFISKFYKRSKLSTLNINDVEFNKIFLESSISYGDSERATSIKIDGERDYKTLDFIFDDKIFIPFLTATYDSNNSSTYSLGFNYRIEDPLQIYGLNILPEIEFSDGIKSVSIDSSLTKNIREHSIEFNPYFIKYYNTSNEDNYMLTLSLTNSFTYDLRNNNEFLFKTGFEFKNKNTDNVDEHHNIYKSSIYGSYSYSKREGKNPLAILSYEFGLGYNNYYFTNSKTYGNSDLYNVYSIFNFGLPYLIPQLDNYYSSSSATNFTSFVAYKPYDDVITYDFDISTMLYSREIQKAYNFILPFYANRFCLVAGFNEIGDYNYNLDSISKEKKDIYLKAYLVKALNSTSLLSGSFGLGVKLSYSLLENTANDRFSLSFILGEIDVD